LHGKGRTAQIEFISGARRDEIGSVSDQSWIFRDLIVAGETFDPLPVTQHIIK
jgi:hypothetical protein